MSAASPRTSRRIVAVLIAVVVVAAGGAAGIVLLTSHTVCSSTELGSPLQEWTPLVLLNSPYKGKATGVGERTVVINGTLVPSVGGYLNATNGEAEGLFTLDTWSIYHYANTTQFGWGSSQRCSIAYQGIDLGASSIETTKVLMPPNSTSDANEPWTFNLSGYSSVVFYNGLPGNSNGVGQYTTTQTGAGLGFCPPWLGPPPPSVEHSIGLPGETVLVPFPLNGGLSYAPGYVPDLLAFDYNFFFDGTWSWYFPPSGGLAFAFSPCPS